MLISGIEQTEFIEVLGEKMVDIIEGNFSFAVMLVTWVSVFLTSIIENVANTATVAKVVHAMIPSFEYLGDMQTFWRALSLGSCLYDYIDGLIMTIFTFYDSCHCRLF